MPPSEQFRDLDGVERRALAQIVAHAPQGDAVVDRGIVAHAAYEDRIFTHALDWGHVASVLALVYEHNARPPAQHIPPLPARKLALDFHRQRFQMAATLRHTHPPRLPLH